MILYSYIPSYYSVAFKELFIFKILVFLNFYLEDMSGKGSKSSLMSSYYLWQFYLKILINLV